MTSGQNNYDSLHGRFPNKGPPTGENLASSVSLLELLGETEIGNNLIYKASKLIYVGCGVDNIQLQFLRSLDEKSCTTGHTRASVYEDMRHC